MSKERMVGMLKKEFSYHDLINEWTEEVDFASVIDFLTENSVIIPPCKVNDQLFVPMGKGEALPVFVYSIKVNTLHAEYKICVEDDESNFDTEFSFEDVGKKIFYTKRDAQKAALRSHTRKD